jgi:dihydropyrimidinase
MDTVIRGGVVTTAEGQLRADVGIRDGRVAAVAEELPLGDAEVVDARGCWVLPGAVDVHTHFADDSEAEVTADDYRTGSLAAAFGGVTSFVNYAFQAPGESPLATVERERSKGEVGVYGDYGIHLVLTDVTVPGLFDELSMLQGTGVTSLKVFTTVAGCRLQDSEILAVLAAAKKLQLMVAVHAEDDGLVTFETERLLREGATSVRYLPYARPALAEAAATAKMAWYARALDVPIYVVHLSSKLALDAVRAARLDGARVFVETRPAYLFMDQTRYESPGLTGQRFVCWPPLRTAEDQQALWTGIAKGEIQTYATDHTSWPLAHKERPGLRFDEVPAGFANVETSLGMLLCEGVLRGRITASQAVAVAITNPAKLFGLWPRKGTLSPGADADLVIFDPKHLYQVQSELMHSASDYDPYEGYEAQGWPVVTFLRGRRIVDHGELVQTEPTGRYLERGPSGSLFPDAPEAHRAQVK